MNKNILLIVEGARAESRFFKRVDDLIKDKLGTGFEICSFNTNIYTLYEKIKSDGEFLNVKDVLIEMHEDYRKLLKDKEFLYIYLIFDLDPHHPRKSEKRIDKKVINNNMKIILEMAKHFDNETEPTKGKLYINYPMMESFKDCNSSTFFDNSYKDEIIENLSSNVKKFKQYIGRKKISNYHINRLTFDNIENLIVQNIFKLNLLINNKWEMIQKYKDYENDANCITILNAQKKLIDEDKLFILNTSLFLIVDYFGSKKENNFYPNLVNKAHVVSKIN